MREKYKHGLTFNYPEAFDGHMIDPPQVNKDVLDGHFPYYSKKKGFVFIQTLFNLIFIILVYPVCYLRYGLHIKGKEIKKRYKKEFHKAFISVSNHVFEWDYICVRSALKCRREYVTIWSKNHNSSLGPLMRKVGSIPIPEKNNYDGLRKFKKDVDQCLNDGHSIHFYAEGSMWYFYEGLRPFKKGAFSFAANNNVPIFPLAISYRPPKGLFKLWKRNGAPCIDIEICSPIFPDLSVPENERANKMMEETHSSIVSAMLRNTPFIESNH